MALPLGVEVSNLSVIDIRPILFISSSFANFNKSNWFLDSLETFQTNIKENNLVFESFNKEIKLGLPLIFLALIPSSLYSLIILYPLIDNNFLDYLIVRQ